MVKPLLKLYNGCWIYLQMNEDSKIEWSHFYLFEARSTSLDFSVFNVFEKIFLFNRCKSTYPIILFILKSFNLSTYLNISKYVLCLTDVQKQYL